MVVLNRIYTRTGDDGTTALGSGERRPKYDLRVAAYGTVNTRPMPPSAWCGCIWPKGARPLVDAGPDPGAHLFDLGADLAVPQRDGKAGALCACCRSPRSSGWSTTSMR